VSTGSLLYPIGYVFLDDNGTPVNAGKVYFSRTGTSTAQDTYSDSTLDTANANPVVLNSAGRASTAIYGDPSSGYDYRIVLKTSADSTIWTYDDVVVDGADTATYSEGSFTGTLTGFTTVVTGTVSYRVVKNSAGTGKIAHLWIESAITGTSNATSMTMTGLPAAVTPAATRLSNVHSVLDNSVSSIGMSSVGSTGVITFGEGADPTSAFTGSGTKGLSGGWAISYPL
jgi:hypothetical protein